MTETLSMLVPLQTLFGWPAAPAVTPLEALGLLGGIPVVVIALIFAVSKADAVMKASKHGPGPQPSDPVWMGGRATSIMGGAGELTSLGDGERRQIDASPSVASSDASSGGAGARW